MKSRKIGLFGKRTKTRAAATAHKKTTLRRGLVETLEKRELLAADLVAFSDGFYYPSIGLHSGDYVQGLTHAQYQARHESTSSGSSGSGLVAEGLDAYDGASLNVAEVEPNGGRTTANFIPLGTASGKTPIINISGTIPPLGALSPTLGFQQDEDWFSMDLRGGDIIDVKLVAPINVVFDVTLLNSRGQEIAGRTTPAWTTGLIADSAYTSASPLSIDGTVSFAYTIPEDGRYYFRVADGTTAYTLTAKAYRPELEKQPIGSTQIVYVDFDGARVNTNTFGLGLGTVRLSPMTSYFAQAGLQPTDEAAFVREFMAVLEENFTGSLPGITTNGYRGVDGVNGHFDIQFLNSFDHPDFDPVGVPNVTQLIIAGDGVQFPLPVRGISNSIDVGNFETEGLVIVLPDVYMNPASGDFVGAVPRAANVTLLTAMATAMGNTASHELGHSFGVRHQDNANATLSLMDSGGLPIGPSRLGVGPDGIFGTTDDIDLDFVSDYYAPAEGNIGIEDSAGLLAYALATGKGNAAVVNGRVYNDKNLSRTLDAGDGAGPNVRVWADANQNGLLDTGEYFGVANSEGYYSLSVPPGTHQLRVESRAGWAPTTAAAVNVTVALNQTVNNVNFGQELLNQNFTGMKWNDANANTLRDPGEVGIGGVFIYIDLDNDNRIDIGEPQTQTAADGSYKLKFPGPGTYSIREVAAGGYVQTYPGAAVDNEHVVTITGDPAIDATRILGLNFGNSLTVDFGDAPASYGVASAGFDPGLRLGANWDAEAASLFSDNAQGDDTNGSDDEDGVALARPLVRGSTGNRLVVTANNTTGAPAYVNAWIDYNKNGVFSSDERVITSQLVATGTSNITFAASNSALLGNTFARVIYSSEASPGPNASVSRGEIEDYVVNVVDAFEVAVDDSDSVARNSVLNEIDVLANDFQLPGDGLEIVSVSSTSADGTATISSNQTILYTPRSGFIGQDVFTYTVRNAVGDTDTATVVVNVTLSFDNPEAVDDSYDVAVNAIDLPLNVIANDIEGQNGALNILSVTQPDKGGKITIATGNKSLRYTPLRSFGGTETFRYTVSDGSGNQSSATVTLHTLPGDRADDDLEIKLVARDLNGQLITAIPQGEKFVIDFVVDDLRHDSTNPGTAAGVFAAYADILYNLQLVSTVNPTVTNSRLNFEASFFNNYNDGQNGDATIPGIIEEFGAFFSLSSMAEPGPVKVASITFEARSPGIATFFPDPADVSPTSDSLLFDTSSTPVPVERIRYLGTSLEVVGDGALFPVAVDDSLVNTIPAGAIQVPIDVLKNDLPGSVGNLSIADFDTNTINGGLVKLNTAGNGLLYTPRSNFNGTDQFQYTITDSRGIQSVATVTLRVGTQNPIVGLDLSVTDLSGAPIDQITVGSQFQLRGYVQDLRSAGSSLGVFAAYEDILYSSTLVSVVDSSTNDPDLGFQVQFGSNYQRVREGDIRTTGLINELGAVSTGDIPLGTGRELLFTVTMTANATGTASFVADPADIKPLHDTLTYNPVEALDVGQIRFGSDTLQILSSTGGGGGGGEGYYNAQNPLDVNDDGFVSPIDALSIINRLNSGDTDLGTVAGEGEVSKRLYVDTNNDGFLAPIDALLVINRLNANSLAAQAEGEGTQEVDLLAPAAGSLATSAPGLEGGSVVSTTEELGLAIAAGDSSTSSSNSGNSASQNAFLAATDGIFDDSDASEEGFLSALAADVEDIRKKRSLA
ncbi:Ig-like domain-containing protein [Aureliella helgolandensis]|uniref:Uncharacterized protein n=1 Tax=Aureliella helgolandensis TaxID=2527968 RepID=A0A518G5R6_9BACT|nr:Ig-like domain-containing protein [Aureliella helgolandensis]QDV23930.1 hypothetical protein Q31a_22400 [Aureliella helgolandensis]